jgi:hypothetical protein
MMDSNWVMVKVSSGSISIMERGESPQSEKTEGVDLVISMNGETWASAVISLFYSCPAYKMKP